MIPDNRSPNKTISNNPISNEATSNNDLFEKIIYLDYNATTPCDPRVFKKMTPYFCEKFGNSSSRSHTMGWEANNAIEEARWEIASLIGIDIDKESTCKEIIFTSGATESNNLAIKGLAYSQKIYQEDHAIKNHAIKNHIITCATEHKCTLEICYFLENDGFEVTYLPVQKNGLINLNQLRRSIKSETFLVSIMMANNEIGIIQPIKEIGEICREFNVIFHTDAAQAVGKIPVNVNDLHVDMMSISSHKMCGPKGIGALYIKRKKPKIKLIPIIHGGGQEMGSRSGTMPTPLCVGFGEACRIAKIEMKEESIRINDLIERLKRGIMNKLPKVYINGDVNGGIKEDTNKEIDEYINNEKINKDINKDINIPKKVPGNLNLSFLGVEGEGIMMGMSNIAVSSGSACTSRSLQASHVLKAIGIELELLHSSIRFSIGRFTTEQEIDIAIEKVCETVERLREMSPVWEMIKEGIDLKTIKWSKH